MQAMSYDSGRNVLIPEIQQKITSVFITGYLMHKKYYVTKNQYSKRHRTDISFNQCIQGNQGFGCNIPMSFIVLVPWLHVK